MLPMLGSLQRPVARGSRCSLNFPVQPAFGVIGLGRMAQALVLLS